jgi:DNA-binding winged helix-turn-helix (wHTH) protein
VVTTFGPFTLDGGARQLCRDGRPIHLSPKAFDLLALLVKRRPEAISKSEILDALWRDTFVSEGNLAVLVKEIRDALGDEAQRPTFIRTVQRFGYAFCAAVAESERVNDAALRPAACWLTWQGARVVLRHGENVLGRDPAADIRVDAVGVSRRHAIIVVDPDAVMLHDLGSKNGTYANNVRIDSPVRLQDGTEIHLGPAVLGFHQLANLTSTQTLSLSQPRDHG